MYQTLLRDASFFELLLRFDDDLAAAVRQAGCGVCGGVLHSARYRRKPRGGPAGLGAEHALRQSFCCAAEGCRRRATPPSLRFLGRKVLGPQAPRSAAPGEPHAARQTGRRLAAAATAASSAATHR